MIASTVTVIGISSTYKYDKFSEGAIIEEKLNLMLCSEDVIAALGWPLAHETIKNLIMKIDANSTI